MTNCGSHVRVDNSFLLYCGSTIVVVLTIFNEGAYLTFNSIFHKALTLF